MLGKASCSYLHQFSYTRNSIKEGFHNARFNPRAPKNPKSFRGPAPPQPPPSAACCTHHASTITLAQPPRTLRGQSLEYV